MLSSMFVGEEPHKDEWNRCASTARHTRMEPITVQGFEREGTAELINDPRMFGENVLDKRLETFEALAVVLELLAAVAIKMCFELPKDFRLLGPFNVVAVAQLIGFSFMVIVLMLATQATASLSLQLFFSIRLLTAGPTGFDKASRFYSDKRIWLWRERAIFGVKFGLVSLLISTGFMLFVKFWTEGAPKETVEIDEARERGAHKILAVLVWGVFMAGTCVLVSLVHTHHRVFEESYSSVDSCHPLELQNHLNQRLSEYSRP